MNLLDKYPEIQDIRYKYRIDLDQDFTLLSYFPVPSVLQSGPQCGIVAVAMLVAQLTNNNKHSDKINEILKYALERKMTKNGEIFSAQWMREIATNFIGNAKIELFNGSLESERFVEFMKGGGISLVPYDADGNHSPCLKNGHKAHWAVINGIANTGDNYHVIGRHGKSKNVAIWALDNLAASNGQLNEFSPDRKNSDLEYILPDGGIAGENGLKNKALLINCQ